MLTFKPRDFDMRDVPRKRVDCEIKDPDGNIVFERKGVEAPEFWSQTAVNVVASKYFYGDNENSVFDMIDRVTSFIAQSGIEQGYFGSADADNFKHQLDYYLVNQYASFNSPVWFNCGISRYADGADGTCYRYDAALGDITCSPASYTYPQCSACFIQSVDDDMDSLMQLAVSEAKLFKHGSGTGTDLSKVRSFREKMSGGGTPSGPISFMKIYDTIAGIVKSGGKTRRAAKMQTLHVDHPDIMEFITVKSREEDKARALIDAGYPASFNGEAYGTVAYQNANLSVRLSDKFMRAYKAGESWVTKRITDGKAGPAYDADEILTAIAAGTHKCGDPGVQFADTINKWHTCKNSGRINSSNPCSEFVFLDDSACNLASINLMKFVSDDDFDVDEFCNVVRLFIVAQDIIVDMSSYPTEAIARNSHEFRPLGLGFANLGAVLMSQGVAYASDSGRDFAASVASLMTATAYQTSAAIAEHRGPFVGYSENANAMRQVIFMHGQASSALPDTDIALRAIDIWDELYTSDCEYANAQVTVLAPTGTISFMMDCATTGIEPEIGLVKYKLLASEHGSAEGGYIKIVNPVVEDGLSALGYSQDDINSIRAYIDEHDTIEGCPLLRENHVSVFDCAFKPANGERFLAPKAHLKMMAAVQPFISGAISKTVNVPEETSVDKIKELYADAWEMGIKAVAIYRDGSKSSQPVSVKAGDTGDKDADAGDSVRTCVRERMPLTRSAITHKFEIAQHEGYITLGFYPDGRVGELFVTMAKEGSTIRGMMDCWATAVSIGLQYGVPFDIFLDKFAHTRFEPSGFCSGDIRSCSSIPDYVFRWISQYIGSGIEVQEVKEAVKSDSGDEGVSGVTAINVANLAMSSDAPPCDVCGAITIRNGACYKCVNCGNSLGCS